MTEVVQNPKGFVFSLEFRLDRVRRDLEEAETRLASARAAYRAARRGEDVLRRLAARAARRFRTRTARLGAIQGAQPDPLIRGLLAAQQHWLEVLRTRIWGDAATADGNRPTNCLRGYQINVMRRAWDNVVTARCELATATRQFEICDAIRMDEIEEFLARQEAITESTREDENLVRLDRRKRSPGSGGRRT